MRVSLARVPSCTASPPRPRGADSRPAMADRLVVIGAMPAGMTAATNARRSAPGPRDRRTREGRAAPATRPAASRTSSAARSTDIDDLVVRTPQQLRDQHRIDVRTSPRGDGDRPRRRRLEVRDLDSDRTIQLGLRPAPHRHRCPADPPRPAGHRRATGSAACRPSTTAPRCSTGSRASAVATVVVVGGGYIGLEMAEAFVQPWRRGSCCVEGGDQPMRTLDPDMAALVADAVRRPRRRRAARRAGHGFERGAVHTDDGPVARRPRRCSASACAPNAGLAARCRHRARRPKRSTGRPPPADQRRGRVGGGRLRRLLPPGLAGGGSTSPSAPWPTSRGGWPASTSAAGTPPSRAWSARPSPRCATPRSPAPGLTEREAAAAGFEFVVGTVESTTAGRLLPRRRRR